MPTSPVPAPSSMTVLFFRSTCPSSRYTHITTAWGREDPHGRHYGLHPKPWHLLLVIPRSNIDSRSIVHVNRFIFTAPDSPRPTRRRPRPLLSSPEPIGCGARRTGTQPKTSGVWIKRAPCFHRTAPKPCWQTHSSTLLQIQNGGLITVFTSDT